MSTPSTKTLLTILALLALGQLISCNLIFFGCPFDKNPFNKLTNETRRWIPYEGGEKIIFDLNTISDTVFVSAYIEETETFFRGDECPNGKMETIKAALTSSLFTDSIFLKIDFKTRLSIESDNHELMFKENENRIVSNQSSGTYESSYIINNKTYNDVLISSCNYCSGVFKIIYGKDEGLIALQINNDLWVKQSDSN